MLVVGDYVLAVLERCVLRGNRAPDAPSVAVGRGGRLAITASTFVANHVSAWVDQDYIQNELVPLIHPLYASDWTASRPYAGQRSNCTDECVFALDGVCDDGGPGAELVDAFCEYATDCADCGERIGLPVAPPPNLPPPPSPLVPGQMLACLHSCSTANDGVCNDGGPGAPQDSFVCQLGSDCNDCGPRMVPVPPLPQPSPLPLPPSPPMAPLPPFRPPKLPLPPLPPPFESASLLYARFNGPGCTGFSTLEHFSEVFATSEAAAACVYGNGYQKTWCSASTFEAITFPDSNCQQSGQPLSIPADGCTCFESPEEGASYLFRCGSFPRECSASQRFTAAVPIPATSYEYHSLEPGQINWGGGNCTVASADDCRRYCDADSGCVAYEMGPIGIEQEIGSNCCLRYCLHPAARDVPAVQAAQRSVPACGSCWVDSVAPFDLVCTAKGNGTRVRTCMPPQTSAARPQTSAADPISAAHTRAIRLGLCSYYLAKSPHILTTDRGWCGGRFAPW